jgi:hypothetical protein
VQFRLGHQRDHVIQPGQPSFSANQDLPTPRSAAVARATRDSFGTLIVT